MSGRQWKVETGARLDINRVFADVGAQHVVDRVLFAKDSERLEIGRPYVAGAKVICEVLEHRLGPKVISYHFRRRENWRRTVGHRQPLTRLVVKEILLNGTQAKTREATASAPKKRTTKPSTRKTITAKGNRQE